MKPGDRIKVDMADSDGNQLYGTILDSNFLGIAVLVKVGNLVSKEYCFTDEKEVMFLRNMLESLEE